MIGAIFGDIVGSVHEHGRTKTTTFPLFVPGSRFTDDTVMTVATAHALLTGEPYDRAYRTWGRRYPHAGYGGSFRGWLRATDAPPYNSWGNGSAMRVSPVAYARDSIEEVLDEAERSAAVTHDHAEGIKGAQAAALTVYLARTGVAKAEIRREIETRFGYDLSRSIADIRPTYRFDVSCQGSVPEALIAFLDTDDLETAVRSAVSLGGDADTQAAIAGAAAEAFAHGVSSDVRNEVMSRLPADMIGVVRAFEVKFSPQ
ncbi:MAG: ADP-ribosylglycohydrolase family protein [Gemmatimonadota bacterium]|nr:ADP-ribosylglycohydrolase family protein [Gemmatimonadota bacterium]